MGKKKCSRAVKKKKKKNLNVRRATPPLYGGVEHFC